MLAALDIGGATIGAFIVVAVVVLVLAGYLITVVLILKKISFTLGAVNIGVRAIANQTTAVEPVVGEIGANVAAIQNALRGVLGLPSVARRSRVGTATGASASSPAMSGVGMGSASMQGRNTPSRPPGSRGGTGTVSMKNRASSAVKQ